MALATSPCSRRCPPAAMAGGGLLLAGSADPNLGGYTISMVTFLWGLPDCADPVSSTRPSGEVNPATHGRLTTTPAMRSILVNPSRASPVLLHFLSGTIAIANLPRLYARLPNMRLRCQMCPGTGRGHLAIGVLLGSDLNVLTGERRLHRWRRRHPVADRWLGPAVRAVDQFVVEGIYVPVQAHRELAGCNALR